MPEQKKINPDLPQPESLYVGAIRRFQEHIITCEPTQESIINGWILFANTLSASSDEYDRIILQSHISHIFNLIENTGYNEDAIYWAHYAFGIKTYSPPLKDTQDMLNVRGELLIGLSDEMHSKAKKFCEVMDQVCWKPDDLAVQYPLNTGE